MNIRIFSASLFTAVMIIGCGTFISPSDTPINRYALVSRHNPVITKVDKLLPLSVGNGEFAFTADITGLQTYPEFYRDGIPLQTQSHWGWHSFPNPENYRLEDTYENYETYGRLVAYPTKLSDKSSPWAVADSSGESFQPFSMSQEKGTAAHWLRANPHRLDLGRIGLILKRTDGSPVPVGEIKAIVQKLDIWKGLLISRFEADGYPIEVQTCCHPGRDIVAVRIESALLEAGRIGVSFRFPYATGSYGKYADDWESPDRHTTRVISRSSNGIDLKRTLDNDSYFVSVNWQGSCTFSEAGKHAYTLKPLASSNIIEFSCGFSPSGSDDNFPGVADTQAASSKHWRTFWTEGGAVDLSGSTDSRAGELERRIVLSQYLTAIQCAGSLPPQETGLTLNSWHGKFHLEMHWNHSVHFAQWGRIELLEKSLPWYKKILPIACKTAQQQGYDGARWPKMVGPEGRQSPSFISPLIVWQQPHPIYLAELCYREHKDRETLENYKDLVFESAEFMASYVVWEEEAKKDGSVRYALGPPLIPYQESLGAKTKNPVFELAYWTYGFETAQRWRERLGLDRHEKWDHILNHLPDLAVCDGKYVAAESATETFTNPDFRNDHPSFLAAYGMVPGRNIDPDIMRQSLFEVMETWNWETTWGSEPPLVAMTAVRLGESDLAIDILLRGSSLKNRFLPNGHCFQNNDILPVFLPANGGLLITVALMTAGWDGSPDNHAPGFPDDGSWTVRWEGIRKIP